MGGGVKRNRVALPETSGNPATKWRAPGRRSSASEWIRPSRSGWRVPYGNAVPAAGTRAPRMPPRCQRSKGPNVAAPARP
jgi:hypothetical protein